MIGNIPVVGRLTDDPKLMAETEKGKAVLFTLACKNSHGGTVFVPVKAFGKLGTFSFDNLKKGKLVAFQELEYVAEEKKEDGSNEYYSHYFKANSFPEFLEKKDKAPGA